MTLPTSRPHLTAPGGDVDVAIVGAGAAGIAAARACLAAGLRVAVLEARDRVGGRAVTSRFGGHPIDLGAHWLHAGALNPLVALGLARGEPLRRSPGRNAIFVDGRPGSASDRRAYGQAFERADLAIAAAARAEADRPISAAMPPLGRWGSAIEATMALISGRPCDEVSVKDFPSDEFGDNYFVRGGYGAYLARLAAGLPVALGSPVGGIDWSGAGVTVDTARGTVRARAAIVTIPVPLLQAGGIAFAPALPEATRDAVGAFLAGTYEHVILNWPTSPFRGADRLVKLATRGRAYGMMTNMDDAPFHYLELDHSTVEEGRSPAERGRLARGFLADTFGPRSLAGLRVLGVTNWNGDRWARCAWSVVPPGRVGARAALARNVGGRIWFAGEAVSDGLWGTVGGAWQEGERAAREIVGAPS